jgi:hypothetical protein
VAVTAADDGSIEGSEVVSVAFVESSAYNDSPGGEAVTIQDNERAESPTAVPDTYAMAAGITELVIARGGVLCNDIAYGDGTLTASTSTSTTTQGGTIALNTDGTFTYAPPQALRDNGGTDTFSYTASLSNPLGVFTSIPAVVTIHVVKVDLQMVGVADNQEETVGGFVQINANNHNGSRLVHPEIPEKRDYEVTVDRNGNRFVDPDLMPVSIVVNPNMGLPGFFVLTATNSGTGQIKLWKDNTKSARAEGTYTQATLPTTPIYVEGTEPGAALKESQVSLTYVFVTANGLLLDAGADRVKVSVTPFITDFSITPGPVTFVNATPTNPGDGRAGMRGGTGFGGIKGAIFDATVTRTGALGQATFIHNVLTVENGAFGVPAGFVFREGSGRTNLKVGLTGGASFPILDKMGGTTAPDYDADFGTTVFTSDTIRIAASDSPELIGPDGRADLTNIAVVLKFKMYVLWRFQPGANSILYTLGTRTWHIVFHADEYKVGQGVTRNLFPNGVVPTGNLDRRDHSNPIVVGPSYNQRVAYIPA